MKATLMGRDNALDVYLAVLFVAEREKRKHLRIAEYKLNVIKDYIAPFWSKLTAVERLTLMFLFDERRHVDSQFTGPYWRKIMDSFVRRFVTAGLAGSFVLSHESRLN